ncbi:uncharacterized protein LOC130895583 [Diorhabda carinulata]|uniref:uncharacterized protein LOC130895583 n=1 Tax=Diorhabda carinulata TaxID=1163345 RepID=UPI0025A09ED6|nr:uncharacterized protein LOC130895583 [Diorhabda carinulata]
MVVVSKEVFYKHVLKDTGCQFVHYWTPSCTTALSNLLPNVVLGTTKFFIPIFIIRLIMDYKMKKKNIGKRSLKRVFRTVFYGFLMGTFTFGSICLLAKTFGLHFYTALLVPGLISGTSILVESKENQNLNTLMFFNSFLETCLNALRLSSVQQTALFMITSGILMHLFEKRNKEIDFNYFWFFIPKLKNDKYRKNRKSLKQIGEISLQAFFKYSLVGVGINLTKRLLGKLNSIFKDPKKIFDVIFHKSNIYFGLFVGVYVGLYMAISSYLELNDQTKEWRGLISGIISGITYICCPTIQVLVLALTTTLQMIYHRFCEKYKITDHFYQRLLIFQLTHAINLHNKFFNDEICSPYYDKMIDACTNNVSAIIKHEVINKTLS